MKKELDKLQKEKDVLHERIALIDNAIESFQNVCNHVDENGAPTWELIGNDSHREYYECKICGAGRNY